MDQSSSKTKHKIPKKPYRIQFYQTPILRALEDILEQDKPRTFMNASQITLSFTIIARTSWFQRELEAAALDLSFSPPSGPAELADRRRQGHRGGRVPRPLEIIIWDPWGPLCPAFGSKFHMSSLAVYFLGPRPVNCTLIVKGRTSKSQQYPYHMHISRQCVQIMP